MAKARALCTCSVCGADFWKEKICRNRREADEWEAWAADHYDLCTDCWKKQEAAKQAEIAAKYPLPTLDGKSKKQIAYATSLRNRYIAEHLEAMDDTMQFVRDIASPESRAEIERRLAADGVTEQEISAMWKSMEYKVPWVILGYKIPWVILHETDAGKLLDVLVRY